MNKVIQKKFIEIERTPRSIKQWYEYATNLDRYWKKEQKRRREVKKQKRDRTFSTKNKHTSKYQQGTITTDTIVSSQSRRQETQQQVLVKPILMEEIEKTNTVIIYPQQQWAEFVLRYNSYVIEIYYRSVIVMSNSNIQQKTIGIEKQQGKKKGQNMKTIRIIVI